jgi:SAM-dependent methyltransferase
VSFKDHFSGHAGIYREARPTYPPALFDWIAGQAPDRRLAWDCGCGNGQATVALAAQFDRVVGTDPSAAQIANAAAAPNIDYRVEPAERSSLGDASVSAVTVAQAFHWLDHARFHDEVRRVARPGALVAVWAYANCEVGLADVDAAIRTLYEDLTGPYWPTERVHVETGYATLPFPYAPVVVPEFAMTIPWNADQLLAYLRSWSATQRYLKVRGEDPVALVAAQILAGWGRRDALREVRWIFHLRAGRV